MLHKVSSGFQLWWWEHVVRYTNPKIYRAVNESISTLSTMIPPNTHSDMIDWVVKKQNTYITHHVTAYLNLCFATDKDITKYQGPEWREPQETSVS